MCQRNSNKELSARFPFGVSSQEKIEKVRSARKYYFLSFDGQNVFTTKEEVYNSMASILVCSRIAISAECIESNIVGESTSKKTYNYYYHVLIELFPNGVLWSSMNFLMKKELQELEFNLVPLYSFGRGLRHILASDQNPFFLNYSLHKANMLFDLMKVKKSYRQYDLPDTGIVTPGNKRCGGILTKRMIQYCSFE